MSTACWATKPVNAMKKQALKTRGRNPGSIDKRLAAYGAMSVAVAAAVAPSARADVMFWTPDVTNPVGGGIYFNVMTDTLSIVSGESHPFLVPGSAAGSFALSNEVAGSLRKDFIFASGANKFAVASSLNALFSSAARLTFGTWVGPQTKFADAYSSMASNFQEVGHWNDLGTGFLGLEVNLGTQIDYGWAEITINPDYSIELDRVAIETSGAPIEVTPEPDSLMLMALGAAGLAAYRRRLAARKPAN